MKKLMLVGILVASVAPGTVAFAQEGQAALGTVTLPRAVMANGQRLVAGSYQVRLTEDSPEPGAGQTPGAERFVEFVRSGKVMGREVATIVTAADADQVFEDGRPGPGVVRVDTLPNAEYVRVWINRGGTHYILHLPPATS